MLFVCVISAGSEPIVFDEYVPNECPRFAKPSDHLIIQFKVTQGLATRTIGPAYEPPNQLFHVLLEQSDTLPAHKGLKGMCENATRILKWDDAENINLSPLLHPSALTGGEEDSNITVSITLHHITDQKDYQLIDAFKQDNISLALDLISEHVGINAMDEWGQTALMLAVMKNQQLVIAGLLNARMPKVNVNAQKSTGYTALFYAISQRAPDIMKALLRRGADPNAKLLQPGAVGNTPLHFACEMEKPDHAALLLEFGANPEAVNEYGLTPLQLLPRGAVTSVKLRFKKIFQETSRRIGSTSSSFSGSGRGEF